MEGACVRLCTSTAYPFHQISRRETDTAQHAMAICSLCEFCMARGVRSVLPAVVVALSWGILNWIGPWVPERWARICASWKGRAGCSLSFNQRRDEPFDGMCQGAINLS